ncbi:MAG: hypothetical protein ACJAUV_001308 [Flavobacteriales bacterium]|jgi:hypothetical protein
MKKIYILSILAFTVSINTNAQNFNFTPTQHIDEDVQAENYSRHEMDMMTRDLSGIQFKWELISNTFLSEWSYSLCDQGGCYVGIPPSGTMSPITDEQADNGMTGFLILNLTASYYYGEGELVFYIYEAGNYANGDTATMYLNWADPSATAIQEDVFGNVELYPNPVNNELVLNNIENMSHIEIIGATGQTVLTENLSQNIQNINLTDLPKGIYIAKLIHENGEVNTRRIFKN